MTDNERKEILLKAKPILFNTDMVRAIFDGRKTVTRRVMKNPPPDVPTAKFRTLRDGKAIFEWDCSTNLCERKTPYYPNDILYVRETWRIWKAHRYDADAFIDFRSGGYSTILRFAHGCTDLANRDDYDRFIRKWGVDGKWHPSIHMPKESARIFLRVTDVRVERLQDCGNMQAKDEGCNCCSQFARIWDSTIKKSDLAKYGWAANPWVWVIEFETC